MKRIGIVRTVTQGYLVVCLCWGFAEAGLASSLFMQLPDILQMHNRAQQALKQSREQQEEQAQLGAAGLRIDGRDCNWKDFKYEHGTCRDLLEGLDNPSLLRVMLGLMRHFDDKEVRHDVGLSRSAPLEQVASSRYAKASVLSLAAKSAYYGYSQAMAEVLRLEQSEVRPPHDSRLTQAATRALSSLSALAHWRELAPTILPDAQADQATVLNAEQARAAALEAAKATARVAKGHLPERSARIYECAEHAAMLAAIKNLKAYWLRHYTLAITKQDYYTEPDFVDRSLSPGA